MTTMAETARHVTAGADTHRDQHVVAALDERGAELGVRSFATTRAGHHALLAWLRRFGAVEHVGVGGTGSYGAGLARFLHTEGVTVVEVNRPNCQLRRSHGKSDPGRRRRGGARGSVGPGGGGPEDTERCGGSDSRPARGSALG